MSAADFSREREDRYWDSRTKEAELNYAVFAYAARCLTEGDFEALFQIGFERDDIQVIDQLRLADLHALSASRAHALNVRVDRNALQWLIKQVRRRRTRDMLRLELLQLDAPSEMMTSLFGLPGHTYFAAREALSIVGGRGRPAKHLSDEAEEARLWHLWMIFADLARPQRLRHEDLWLVIGRELDSGLRKAWNLSQQWARDAGNVDTLRQTRARYGEVQLAQEETVLRAKHGVHALSIDGGRARSDASPALPADKRPKPRKPATRSIARANSER